MTSKLTKRDYLYIGSMLFGLFFGAGNLIFPVRMGQEAGANVFQANLGFLITGIGLPFLGVIVIGLTQSSGVYDLACRIGKKYAFIFTMLLYLIIGPFFSLPRLATTSFQIGITPFLGDVKETVPLAIFSLIFFILVWLMSRRPTKLLDYVGKFLNPLFLLLLGSLLAFAFIKPMGGIKNQPIQDDYMYNPVFTGFTQGYNTLDALAALAFGIIIVNAIRNKGVDNPKNIAQDMIKSGIISVILMGVIYTLLSSMGTMSLGKFTMSENGGIALAQIANYYMGTFGTVLMSLIVIVACLKTSVGITVACADTFVELFPKRSYAFFVALIVILPCIFANVGLTNIIAFSLPVLFFIYPLAITLILLALLEPFFNKSRLVYQVTTYFTLFAALLDGLNNSPEAIKQLSFVEILLNFGRTYLPLFNLGLGWVVPASIGFLVSFIYVKLNKQTVKS